MGSRLAWRRCCTPPWAPTQPASPPASRLREDLGINSLTLIDVACAAEDRFGIRIPDDDLERFVTVGDAMDFLRGAA